MDLFSLVARLTLDKSGYEQGINEAESGAKSFGDKLKSGLGVAAKVGGAAIASAATALSVLTKQSVASYAEYEQLTGGVETLFGTTYKSIEEFSRATGIALEDAGHAWEQYQARSDTVMENASRAYKTAGMSANEYMSTVTSFAASLNASLGENAWQSANFADQAVRDMADNANKMGTDMAAIQNAYQGFAKQNFTMLDNLKLGYGGTKEEMERLLRDAEKLEGFEAGSLKATNFADIITAIHAVQNELGITGTTAKEASGTISGSISMLKSAWANLVTGLGDENANFEQLIGNVVDSAVTAGNNLIPRIEQIIQGVGKLVEKLGPVIAEKLPGIIDAILPSMFSAATALVQSLTQSIPSLIGILLNVVLENLPMVIQMGTDLILAIAQGIAQSLPELTPTIISVVLQIVDILTDPDTLSNLIDAALELMIALAEGLIEALPKLIEKAPEIIMNLVEALLKAAPKVLEAGVKLMGTLAEGLLKGIGSVVNAVGDIGKRIFEGFSGIGKKAMDWGKDMIDNFTEGIKAFIHKPLDAIGGLASKIKKFLGFSEPEEGPLSNFHTYAPDMMKLFAEGIQQNQGLITDAINSAFALPGMAANNASAGQEFEVPRAGTGQPVTLDIRLMLKETEIGRALVPYIDAEHQRYGVSLAGGAY